MDIDDPETEEVVDHIRMYGSISDKVLLAIYFKLEEISEKLDA